MTLPTFFVAGTPKGGTNTLLSALATHPDVYVPADIKEPMYFFWHGCDVTYRFEGAPPIARDHHRDIDAYRRLFAPGEGRPAVGEGSVHYFASPRAAANLRAIVPDARILLVLRDPVSRAISHHGFNRMRGLESRSFDDAVAAELADPDPATLYPTYRYVGNGLYGEHLSRYLDLFPREQVLTLLFEDLTAEPTAVVRRAEGFLDVAPGGSQVDSGFRNETVSGGGLMSATRHLRTSPGRLGGVARGVERAAGDARAYRAVKHKVKVASRRSSRAKPAAPEISDRTRAVLADRFRDDATDLARLSGLDLTSWPSLAPAEVDEV